MEKSIVTEDMEHCLVCGTTSNIQIHHCIHGRANRKLSDKYGLVVPLCIYHHTGSNYAVHTNRELDLQIIQLAQRKFEEKYSHEEFMKVFMKNYL